jgi:hypothetical protein
MARRWMILAALTLVAGCGGDQVGRYALEVEIRDAVTGTPLAYAATLIVEKSGYSETVHGSEQIVPELQPDQAVLLAGFQQTGLFRVQVEHPGYVTWEKSGVRVRGDSRSPLDGSPMPRTVRLVANLEAAPAAAP